MTHAWVLAIRRCLTLVVLVAVSAANIVFLSACDDSKRFFASKPQPVKRSTVTAQRQEDLSTPVERGAGNPLPSTAPSVRAVPLGSCSQTGWPRRVAVSAPDAPVFIEARVRPVPLTTLALGRVLIVWEADGEWYLIQFDDRRWGPRVGYIHCSDVTFDEDR